jgi:hypothetical protein
MVKLEFIGLGIMGKPMASSHIAHIFTVYHDSLSRPINPIFFGSERDCGLFWNLSYPR